MNVAGATDLPATKSGRGLIDDAVVQWATRLVDRSDICPQIATWRELDSANDNRHAGGRPAIVDDRAVFVIFVLLAIEHSPLFISNAAETIEHRLSDSVREPLGLAESVAHSDWYSLFWRAWRRVHDVLDAFPAPRHRYLSDEEQAEVKAARDPVMQARRIKRMNWVANQLVEASWNILPRDVRRRWKGNIAVDATPVVSFAKPSTKRSKKTVELDAAWYVREGDHRDAGDASGRVVARYLFGWETHIAIATPNDPTQIPDFPLLATAVSFDKPGHRVAENAMSLLVSMDEREMPKRHAVSDRAYWPGSDADKLQLPARALGWQNVNDYKTNQLGLQGAFEGAILVEGALYLAEMPESLINATIDFRNDEIDEATWRARIDARTPYHVRYKSQPDADGYYRIACPGIGKHATVNCPHHAITPGPNMVKRVDIPASKESAGRLTTQKSVVVPPTFGAKFRQDIRYGTTEWYRMYSTARNTIEGFNGYLKDGANESLADPTRRRLRGRTAQHFLVALLVMSANVRKIRTWLAEQESPDGTVIRINRRKRRRSESLTSFLPDANAPPGKTGTEN